MSDPSKSPQLDQNDQISRKVSFLVSSETLDGAMLTARIGLPSIQRPISQRTRTFSYSVWEIEEVGTGTADLSSIIASVMETVTRIYDKLLNLKMSSDAAFMLRVVQYIGDDPVGPGFCLEAGVVAQLAGLEASVDVDQYYSYPD